MKLPEDLLEQVKAVPICNVFEWYGLNVRRTGKWLSVKGDASLKADVHRNTYTDFSGKYGAGTAIDFVMNYAGCDFKTAVVTIAQNFCGYVPPLHAPLHAPPDQPTRPPAARPAPPQEKTQASKQYIPSETAKKYFSRYEKNKLAIYAASLFGKPISEISGIFERYRTGTGKAGETVFFYCDTAGRYEQPKVFEYDQTTGKRQKIYTPQGFTTQEGYTRSALFGAHLLADSGKVVLLVESEKTAILAAVCFPELLPIATGGKENLKPEYWKALHGKNVIVLPDADEARQTWLQCVKQMRTEGINARYLDLCPDRSDKSDLADYIAESIAANEPEPQWLQRLQTMLNSFFDVPAAPAELPQPETLPSQADQLPDQQKKLVKQLFDVFDLQPVTDEDRKAILRYFNADYPLPSEQSEPPF